MSEPTPTTTAAPTQPAATKVTETGAPAPAATDQSAAASSTTTAPNSSKNVVVFGGTGAQGSAFVRALSEYPGYKIFLLVRSNKPTPLSSLPSVHTVEVTEYMDHAHNAFVHTHLHPGEVHAVFSVQGYVSKDSEVRQGIAVAKAAKEWHTEHFIYASANPEVEDKYGMSAKVEVEREILKLDFPKHTFLGDTDFMDNWLPHASYEHKVYRSVLWRKTFTEDQLRTKKLMLVSTRDIGRAGAKALVEGFSGKIPLAGDALSMNEIIATYEDVYGHKPGEALGLVASATKWLSHEVGGISRFYREVDSEFDVQLTRNFLPDVEDFRSFLVRTKEVQEADHEPKGDKETERRGSRSSFSRSSFNRASLSGLAGRRGSHKSDNGKTEAAATAATAEAAK